MLQFLLYHGFIKWFVIKSSVCFVANIQEKDYTFFADFATFNVSQCIFNAIFADFFGFGEAEDDERPALVSQDSGLDETVNPVDTDMPEQRPIQDKSSAESQFTDSGFGDDGSMSLTQNESTTSQERPSDILIAAECVPADLTVNTEQDVQRTNAQDAEHNAMRERVSTILVYELKLI